MLEKCNPAEEYRTNFYSGITFHGRKLSPRSFSRSIARQYGIEEKFKTAYPSYILHVIVHNRNWISNFRIVRTIFITGVAYNV